MKQLNIYDFSTDPTAPNTSLEEIKGKEGADYRSGSIIKGEGKQEPLEEIKERIPQLYSKVRITITKETDILSYNYFIAYYPYVLKESGEIMSIFKANSGRELCKVYFNGNVHIFGLDEVIVIDEQIR